jgi:hypothetical protein
LSSHRRRRRRRRANHEDGDDSSFEETAVTFLIYGEDFTYDWGGESCSQFGLSQWFYDSC